MNAVELASKLELPPRAVALVLAGDHVCKTNYALLLADHVAHGRPCTVGCIEVARAAASAFGVMAAGDARRFLRTDRGVSLVTRETLERLGSA